MAPALRQKKFKVEFEFTVSMDEVDPQESMPSLARQLQQALLADDSALSRLMLSAVLNKLQGYADYLADQDDLAPLKKIAQAIEPGDQVLPAGADFSAETRALRTSAMQVRIDSSAIQEEIHPGAGEAAQWQPVWRDLRPESELGRLFEQLAIPTTLVRRAFHRAAAHSLRVRYLTRRPDGIHIAGRCTCQDAFEGVGCDESQALDDLLNQYKPHSEANSLASRIQSGWKIRIQPGKQ